jgi:hypothetical protein
MNMKTTKTKSQVGEREEAALRTPSTSTLALRTSFVHMLDIHTITIIVFLLFYIYQRILKHYISLISLTIIDFLFNTYHKIQKQ